MIEIKRDNYLQKLINSQQNGLIKIITGIRRTGKSYLLDPIFRNYLLSIGIKEDHIIKLELDKRENAKFRNPDLLNEYVLSLVKDNEIYYVLLDEIQLVEDFESVLNGFLYHKNLDIYVTGSNSKFLSTDVITEFRGRGEEIRVYPFTFSEFCQMYNDRQEAWNNYLLYGGLPLILSMKNNEEKAKYLKNLFQETYFKDIIERNSIKRSDILEDLLNIIASSTGSLTNSKNIYNTFVSKGEKEISINTINSYLRYIEDAFIINKSNRYDIKGKKYINTPLKYYFTDIGLRNVMLNFRQIEENHLMENVIYNELLSRGYSVDVGVVESRYYIQTTLYLEDREKTIQEERPFLMIEDNFKKIIIVRDSVHYWYTEEGILIIGIQEFLLNKNSLDL